MPFKQSPFRIESIHVGNEGGVALLSRVRTDDSKVLEKLDAIYDLVRQSAKTPQVAAPSIVPSAPASSGNHQFDDETYEALRTELNLVRAVIDRTKEEVASFSVKGRQFGSSTNVNGELDAVLAGIEDATQQILDAAEAIDQSASALPKVTSADQRVSLCEDVAEKVVSIFEACNFQDLAGQRIAKVMKAMSFIEAHMNVMIGIWGDHGAPAGTQSPDARDDESRLLNGPKLAEDIGHASQLEIDSLFD